MSIKLSAARSIVRVIASYILQQLARVSPSKPYKPRRLIMDMEHKLMRDARKHARPNSTKAKQKRTRDKWEQKNAPALKLRQKVVREKRKSMGLD